MRVDCAVLVSLILLNLANEVASRELSGVAQRWFDDPRCECCKDGNGVPLSSLYKTEIHKNCFGGGGTEEIGWRLVDVLAQTSDGTLTVEPMAQRRVCASHRCRGSITTFWDAVHDCAASGYWKVVGLAFATAKSQCHQLDQQPQEEGQWLARIRATFHGVDTNDDAALLNLERVAERSALEALSVSSDGVPIHSSALEVKCSSVPIFKGGLGQDSVRLEAPTPPPNRTCARVTSRWPAHQEQGVAPDLKYVILHFDRCVRATNETQLVLAISPAGKNGTLKVPLKYGMADLPSETLVFPLGELELGTNRQIDLSLTGEPVRTCKDQADICEDFASTFYTVITDPAVIRTQLVADRWLRSTFDLPVEVADAKKFHVTLRPWFAGSRVAYNTAEMMLTASTHLYTVAAENDQNVVPAKDDPLLETQCVYSLEAMSDRKSCNDQRTFEADLCDVFSCKGSRIPCGGKVEVEYPEGIALRAGAGVLSVKGSGEAFSRRCAAPQLLSSIKLHVTRADDEAHPNRGLLEIAWSQPVVFNKDEGWKTFTLCHSDTRGLHCPMRDVAFSDSNVIPCTGAGGDCAVWAIKLPTADLPLCGGMEIIIEHGAVKSVDDDEPNKRSVGHINGTEPCPTWDNEMTCSLVDGDRLRADEKLLDWRSLTVSKPQLHLQTDLDRMNVKYTEISWFKMHDANIVHAVVESVEKF